MSDEKKDHRSPPQETNGPVVATGPTAGQNRTRNKDGQWRKMTLPPRATRRAHPLTLDKAKKRLAREQDHIVALELEIAAMNREIEATKRNIGGLQRVIWRHEQELGDEITNEEIDADLPFRIRFPDYKAR